MHQIIQQTREEKIAMYMKLSKEELVQLLINNQGIVESLLKYPQQQNIIPATNETVPFYEICSCNPKNGGSGICGCTVANNQVYREIYITKTTTES